MSKLKGIKTETKEVVIDVDDIELIRAIRTRVGISRGILEGNEIGYWSCDDGGGYFEHASDVWKCISKDEKKIEVFKAIKVIEEYMKLVGLNVY